MKKLVTILFALISVICVSFSFIGCGDKQPTGQPEEEIKVPIEVRGQFYTLKAAYDNGWLNEDDLKSIACGYYEFYKYEENPYSGLFDPRGELSEEIEKEIKKAYLEQIDKQPDEDLEKVNIYKYYGHYNGNYVVSVVSEFYLCDIIVDPEFEIGGVIFKDFSQGEIRVYHI